LAIRITGGKDRLPDDDGGHLIATQFNGPGDIGNLVLQNSQINRSEEEWYKIAYTKEQPSSVFKS